MSLTTMTSTSDILSSTSTSSQAQETSDSGGPAPKIPTTTSLLFGFLVSFLGLFIVFVAWGLASRYMMDRRRERLALESELIDARVRKGGKPALWDVWAAPGYEKWAHMMPLSVEVCNAPFSPSLPPPHLEMRPRASFTLAEQLLNLFHGVWRDGFSFGSTSRRTRPRDAQGSGIPKSEGPIQLQIAVLVAMPSSVSRSRDDARTTDRKRTWLEVEEHSQDTDKMSDVAVGVTAIPWDKERMDFG